MNVSEALTALLIAVKRVREDERAVAAATALASLGIRDDVADAFGEHLASVVANRPWTPRPRPGGIEIVVPDDQSDPDEYCFGATGTVHTASLAAVPGRIDVPNGGFRTIALCPQPEHDDGLTHADLNSAVLLLTAPAAVATAANIALAAAHLIDDEDAGGLRGGDGGPFGA